MVVGPTSVGRTLPDNYVFRVLTLDVTNPLYYSQAAVKKSRPPEEEEEELGGANKKEAEEDDEDSEEALKKARDFDDFKDGRSRLRHITHF